VHRVQGVLERAHIKLAAVATDIMGVAGRAILAALMAGRAAPETMAAWAQGRMRATRPLWAQALTGVRRDHHRRLLARQLAHIDFLDEQLDALRAEMLRELSELEAEALPPPPAKLARATGEVGSEASQEAPSSPLAFAQALVVLETMPGVEQRSAERLVAEWGPDRRRCGTASRLSAWTGVAPGHEERAGQPRSEKTGRGHRTLRTGVPQMAHAAARTKGPDVSALSQRLAARRGKQWAILAVAQAIVVRAFHRLARHETSHEVGHHYWDEQRRDQLVERLTRRIERLAYRVSLDPAPAA
jgi:transposase